MKKVMIITGSSRGIGTAAALLAGQQGYAVCVNYRQNHTAADAVVRSIKDNGSSAIAIQADVSIEQDVLDLFAKVDEQLDPVTALSILWLLSDSAPYTTGSLVDVAGGR